MSTPDIKDNLRALGFDNVQIKILMSEGWDHSIIDGAMDEGLI